MFNRQAKVSMAPAYQAERRIQRRPQHGFNLRTRPFQIQPFMIAPVLPNETLKNLLMQTRVVSDPIKSPLVGWWQEYYFFYVKLRDLDQRDLLSEMMIKPDLDVSSLFEATSNAFYNFGSTINWTKHCLKRVTEEYFRNEGEAWDAFAIDGMPVASVNTDNFTNSLIDATLYHQDDIDVDADGDGNITTSEIEAAMRQWELLKAMNMTEMDFEDYLATFGIKGPSVELHVPELVRYTRTWTYPTNHVDPATGAPSSAVSWSISERADKGRFFKEPGFLIGVTCTRPKIYFKNLSGSGVGMMRDATSWLPAIEHDDNHASLQHWPEATGPVSVFNTVPGEGYIIDVRDLLIYGDQYLNYDRTTVTDANLVGLPTATGQRRYVDSAMVDSLFVTPATANNIRQDGIVNLTIAGRQRDRTPGVPVTA